MPKQRPNRKSNREKGQTLRRCSGQTMAEFALMAPVLVLLLFGLTYAAFYGFRAAAADWGVFITGVAEGVYDTPVTGQARLSVPWIDIRSSIVTNPLAVQERQVRSQIQVYNTYPLTNGFGLTEAHEGASFFRLWRFYAGPPTGDIE